MVFFLLTFSTSFQSVSLMMNMLTINHIKLPMAYASHRDPGLKNVYYLYWNVKAIGTVIKYDITKVDRKDQAYL